MLNDIACKIEFAFATYDAKVAEAYACTCTWSGGPDEQHDERCPRELRLRDIEAAREDIS
jgi:hypothetical protein